MFIYSYLLSITNVPRASIRHSRQLSMLSVGANDDPVERGSSQSYNEKRGHGDEKIMRATKLRILLK